MGNSDRDNLYTISIFTIYTFKYGEIWSLKEWHERNKRLQNE